MSKFLPWIIAAIADGFSVYAIYKYFLEPKLIYYVNGLCTGSSACDFIGVLRVPKTRALTLEEILLLVGIAVVLFVAYYQLFNRIIKLLRKKK